MRTKILAAFVAGGLLVGAGFLASAVSAPGTAQAQEKTDEPEERGPLQRLSGFLSDVLDDLVGDGTITRDQANAIVEATENRAAELNEERKALREDLAEALEDDVLTEEEASAVLPDDHWLFGDAFEEAWEDGQLTTEEIRESHPHRGRPFHRGLRFGALLDDGGIDQDEYDNLPESHPLKQADLSEHLEDGLITPDELREAIRAHREARFGDDA